MEGSPSRPRCSSCRSARRRTRPTNSVGRTHGQRPLRREPPTERQRKRFQCGSGQPAFERKQGDRTSTVELLIGSYGNLVQFRLIRITALPVVWLMASTSAWYSSFSDCHTELTSSRRLGNRRTSRKTIG